MDNKKIPTHLGTIVFLILAVTAVVFVWKSEKGKNGVVTNDAVVQPGYQNNSVSKQGKKQDSRQQINDADISTDNWKSYIDKKYNYSIKYPSAWVSDFIDGASFYVKELQKPGESHPSFGNVLSDNLENLKNISGDYFINFSVYKNIGSQTTLKEWRSNDGNNYQEVLIKGYQALKFNEKPHKSSVNKDIAGSLRYYFIDKNINGYEITVWYKDGSNGIGEKIISTFDFLN